jgi:cytochrome c-type biogenesis protein CcmH
VKGKSDEEIKDFMLARYGDFVLYKPPVRTSTVPLWVGPFVLLAIGLVVVVVIIRRRAGQAQPVMNTEDAERARKLLDDDGREQQS